MLKRNILIFHSGALGDFVITWPLAIALGRIHPQSRVIYVTHPSKGKLAERVLRLESASIEAGWHHLLGDGKGLPAESEKLLKGAHTIYSFISTQEDDWSRAVRRINPDAVICCLSPAPPEEYGKHATEWILEQLKTPQTAPAAEAMRQMIHSIRERGLRHVPKSAKTAVLHPGSGSPTKCWPAERFVKVGHVLEGQKRPVRFILGEAELERWPAARIAMLEQVAEIIRPEDYIELLDSLGGVSLYIGNDSGPTHLAGMLGIPTVAIFGPTDPNVWGPLGPKVKIVRGGAIENVQVQDVLSAAGALTGGET